MKQQIKLKKSNLVFILYKRNLTNLNFFPLARNTHANSCNQNWIVLQTEGSQVQTVVIIYFKNVLGFEYIVNLQQFRVICMICVHFVK